MPKLQAPGQRLEAVHQKVFQSAPRSEDRGDRGPADWLGRKGFVA